MSLKQVFINPAGRLRSGWRVLIFIALLVVFGLALGILAPPFARVLSRFAPSSDVAQLLENFIARALLLATALVAGYLCTRLLEGLPWRSLGLTLHARWFRDFLVGSLVGSASLALTVIIATAAGGLSFTVSSRALLGAVAQTLIFSAALFVLAALAEEALFRGYPLQTLTRAKLAWLAVLLTSLPFAAVHLKNPNVAAGFTFVNTALAGVWLAAAYLRTRSLWFPLGVHWAWNWMMASLLGLPVSGITSLAPQPLLHGTDLGPAWLTGGSYGPEGGLACTIALVVSTLFIWRTRLVSATPELLRLTSQENPVNGSKLDEPSAPPSF
jgi:membrane protease YdiL (CAAX protease family)